MFNIELLLSLYYHYLIVICATNDQHKEDEYGDGKEDGVITDHVNRGLYANN